MMTSLRNSRAARVFVLSCLIAWPLACSDEAERPPAPGTTGGRGGSGNGGKGGAGDAGSGATTQGGKAGGNEGGAASGGIDNAAGVGADGPEGGTGEVSGGSANRGGGANTGGVANRGGAANRGGNSNEGGMGGESPSCPTDGVINPPATLSGVCDAKTIWGAGMAVSIENAGKQLISITPDELTMVWYAETSGPLMTYVGDRADPDAGFADAPAFPGNQILAVSPDGLRLVTASSDLRELSAVTRATRGDAFETIDSTEFADLNEDAAALDKVFKSAVIAADDRLLYYLLDGGDVELNPIRISRRNNAGPWPVGTPVDDCELEANGSNKRLPTGVSADGLTLFYYDEVARAQRAAYRAATAGPIVWVQTLPMRDAQVNEACNRLYFSGSGPSFAEPE